MRGLIQYILLPVVCLALFSCEKEEGEGGKATITGKIIIQEKSPSCIPGASYSAPEERVYIIYGTEDSLFDDEVRTNFDGTYQFKWLRKGTYTIYAYSDCECDGCIEEQEPVFQTVEIKDRKEELTVPVITVIKEE